MDVLELKVPPPVVALALGAAMWVVAATTPSVSLPLSGRLAAAIVVAAAGVLIELAGMLSFAHARTTVDPLHPGSASRLVMTGVYRFTRNPMYLGDLLMLLGWGVYLSNILALVLTPAFVFYVNRFQIAPEERALSAIFGAPYAAYRERVRRWL
jgi:protein-S-isoprenylcysteine O-methyltransferase Ste14